MLRVYLNHVYRQYHHHNTPLTTTTKTPQPLQTSLLWTSWTIRNKTRYHYSPPPPLPHLHPPYYHSYYYQTNYDTSIRPTNLINYTSHLPLKLYSNPYSSSSSTSNSTSSSSSSTSLNALHSMDTKQDLLDVESLLHLFHTQKDWNGVTCELKKTQELMEDPNLWQENSSKAIQLQKKISYLKSELDQFESLKSRHEELKGMIGKNKILYSL